ncbi:hypothetical protein DL95DRAFT_455146 [Leptodontidium sp. 2 PMI_412]|nr:hypothetical protein DL95DRAFT_455146 [Leptodontidium sp. 2 PMI_412]
MQRDVDLTIGDIVLDQTNSSVSELGSISRHIVSQETQNDLRFLKIPDLQQYSDLYPEVTCELTERGDHLGEKRYIAVSYCWESFTNLNWSVNGRSSQLLPTVRVKQRGQDPRNPRCPSRVLLRAIAFGISYGVSLIWIDQECVDQEDPTDVQNHLECNHAIYNQAEFKIGPLNFQLSKTQVSSLISLEVLHILGNPESAGFRRDLLGGLGPKGILREVQSTTRLLRSISRDRWFTRAWIFQERYSANVDMYLLIPLSAEALRTFDGYANKQLVGEDYPLDVGSICAIAAVIRSYVSDPELDQLIQGDIILRDALYESLKSLHEVAELLSGPIFSGTPFDRVFETFRLTGADLRRGLDSVRNFHLHKTFLQVESCDCRVISDRVAILSNIMNFEWRLPTTSYYSYSFALVALMSANSHLPSVLIQEESPTPAALVFSHPVPAHALLGQAYLLKQAVAEGREAQRRELENISGALTQFFGRDVTRHAEFLDAIRDAVDAREDRPRDTYEDPLTVLSRIHIGTLRRRDVIPLSATIEGLIGGIVAEDHIDNLGLQSSHGDTIVRHGMKTNQLRGGARFISFVGEYRWRSEFVEKFFD